MISYGAARATRLSRSSHSILENPANILAKFNHRTQASSYVISQVYLKRFCHYFRIKRFLFIEDYVFALFLCLWSHVLQQVSLKES